MNFSDWLCTSPAPAPLSELYALWQKVFPGDAAMAMRTVFEEKGFTQKQADQFFEARHEAEVRKGKEGW